MTVLTSESTLLGTQGRLPRVNLLPPEIAEQRKLRRIQMGLGATGLGAVGVVGLLYLSAVHGVSTAQKDLDAAKSQQVTVQSQMTQYAGVTQTIAAAEAAQAQLTTAMGDEIRYSQLLNDISLSIPSNVWLTTLSYTPAAAIPGAAPAAPAAPGASGAVAATGVGTLNVAGVAYTHDDVALWLEALAKLNKTYNNPYFSSSTEALLSGHETVNWLGTATVLSTAQSGRYNTPAGG